MSIIHPLRGPAIAALVLLSGCATAPKEQGDAVAAPAAVAATGVVVSTDPQAAIERRATDRWKLLVAKDAVRAYGYLTPGYRATMTATQYDEWLRSRQIKWVAGKYVDRTCSDATTCTVSMEIVAETKLPSIPGVQQGAALVEEQWLQIDGVWYHLPKNAR
jgi:hypothetical protein